MKTCSKCKILKSLNLFVSAGNGKVKSYCKECHAISQRKYRKNNPEKIKESNKKRYIKNKETQKEYLKSWRLKNKHKTKLYWENYCRKHPEKAKQLRAKIDKKSYEKHKSKRLAQSYKRHKIRYKYNPNFRLACLYRSKLQSAINKSVYSKDLQEVVGCSYDEFLNHLKSRFDQFMTFDNYGTVWHIDHIIPISKFNLLDRTELKKAMHYTNLQPLTATENRKKANKVLNKLVDICEKELENKTC